MEIMSGAGKLARVNGAIHEAGQLRISFTQFGKSYPRDAASLTDHPSTTQYGKLPLCTLHQLQDQILEQSKSAFLSPSGDLEVKVVRDIRPNRPDI